MDNSSETGEKAELPRKSDSGTLGHFITETTPDNKRIGAPKKLTPTHNPHKHRDTYFGNTLARRHLHTHLFLAKTNNSVSPTPMTKHILRAVKLLSQTLMS